MPRISKRKSQISGVRFKPRSRENFSDATPESSSGEEDEYRDDQSVREIDFSTTEMTQNVGDIMKLCQETCNIRYLSTLLYMSLRHFNIPTTALDVFMSSIGAYNRKTSHKWSDVFLNQSLDEFLLDRRGGKRGDGFYDLYPEIEIEARTFTVEACGRKAASFTVQELAEFIDSKFYELYDLKKTSTGLIRSVESVRLDMRKWGINYSANGLRPYFIGHERQDVIEHRGRIIDYFLAREKMYYRLTDDDQPEWIKPTSPNPVILITRDESSFRSGEISNKRWIVGDTAPFHIKGRGKTLMISDFMVAHDSGPFFRLSDQEYADAVKKFPDLEDDEGLRYEKNSATASIAIGTDTYFDNDTILSQFERLFKLLQFKTDYKGHDIEILVDNATTHSKKDYSISGFSKKIGTRCEVQSIDCIAEKVRGWSK
ncbi:unnamed protein product [Didymodactylos carnosus]|uniref:Uncharacterized protein n=1 Tax=Didymodactylos carnosus TaxID=1234261 RepID=A0A8S2DNU8_9BILA|nr:unnamed protein product [Didymodactylos carnosus]CAF3787012.1 unnamed protein product [Didymodactylos carnosus]